MVNEIEKRNNGYKKTHQLLVDSYIELSHKKHYSQINVTELCKKANINRATFYKHFKGTWEIKEAIEARFVGYIVRLHEEFRGIDVINESYTLFNRINNDLEKREDYVLSIYKMKGSGVFSKALVDKVGELFEEDFYSLHHEHSSVEKRAMFSYIMGGIIYSYHDWLEGKIKCSLHALTVHLAKCVQRVNYILNQKRVA